MVFQLDDKELWFPNPYYGDENGMIAVGGDLSIDRLLLAYSNGIFPWYAFRYSEECHWYCPLNRFVIFPEEIHVSHSMRTLMNKGRYKMTVNQDFHGVINHCSTLRYEEEGAWLGEEMIEAYIRLHEQGFAASIEVWDTYDIDENHRPKLVGGLYGVCIGKAFFGESMFSLVPSGSKLALIHLARVMHERGGKLIDCQFETPHLKSMGGRHITYKEYMEILNDDGEDA